MKPITIILIFCTCFKLFAQQNLVPNPSFEEYVACPENARAFDTSRTIPKTLKHWFNVNPGTPDYYHKCSPAANYQVPKNVMGFQLAKSGNAYVGLLALYGPIRENPNSNLYSREYISCKLVKTLEAEHLYEVTFFVSPSDGNLLVTSSYYGFVSSLGIHFTEHVVYQNTSYQYKTPQIKNSINNFLSDTQNWIKITGIFKAQGNESYLTIGNFLERKYTPILLSHNNPVDSNRTFVSYYYVDDVSVVKYNPSFKTTHHLICKGDSINVSRNEIADSSIWNDGSLVSNRALTEEGTWWVNNYFEGQLLSSDTLVLTVLSTEGSRKDTLMCLNQSVLLQAQVAQYYVWSNGSTTSNININQPGLYWVKRMVNNCVILDSFNVSLLDYPTLPPLGDTSFCKGGSITIGHAAQPNYVFTWLPNHTQHSTLQVFSAGQYVLQIDSASCTAYDTVVVTENSLPLILLNPDTVVCFSDLNQIALDAGAFESYLWEPTGETTRTVYATEAMLYLLTVTDTNGCKNSLKVSVDEACAEALYFPNVFTPNGDGINDAYEIKGATQKVQDFSIQIYNRWGTLEYSSSDVNQKWEAHHTRDGVYILIAHINSMAYCIE
jgi:gliding motility-associated-like protein